jgi:hypothetical protein
MASTGDAELTGHHSSTDGQAPEHSSKAPPHPAPSQNLEQASYEDTEVQMSSIPKHKPDEERAKSYNRSDLRKVNKGKSPQLTAS